MYIYIYIHRERERLYSEGFGPAAALAVGVRVPARQARYEGSGTKSLDAAFRTPLLPLSVRAKREAIGRMKCFETLAARSEG